MENFILIFVPRAKWAEQPYLGWMGFIYDERNVLGCWNGHAYTTITAAGTRLPVGVLRLDGDALSLDNEYLSLA